MAFFSILLMNVLFSILFFTACGLLLAGIVLLIVGLIISKHGKKKSGWICKIVGIVCIGIVVAITLYFLRFAIFPKD